MGESELVARRPVLETLGWLTFIAGTWLWLSFTPTDRWVSAVAGIATVVYGVRVFIGHGGPRVTVLGLVSLAAAMFVGFAGVYAALDPTSRATSEYLGYAILTGLLLTVLTSLIAWPQVRTVDFQPATPNVTRWCTGWGLIALFSLIVLHSLNVGLESWLEGGAFTATVVLAVGVLWRPNARLLSPGMAVVAAAFTAYTVIFHTGGGRLRIVALACALAILTTARFPRRQIKWAIVAATPLALVLLARQRLTLQEELSGGVETGNNGLESMLVPIVNLAELLRGQAEGRALDFGAHLLSIPTAFVPESWVPWAPSALGYQLVEVQAPSKVGTGFTTAGTLASESVFGFGIAGIFLAAPILAWLFRVLDSQLARAAAGSHSRAAILTLILWAMVGGAVADMAWGGTHVFVMRTVLRLPVWLSLGALALLADALDRQRLLTSRVRMLFHPGVQRP